MRLWHYKTLDILPTKLIVNQWRELVAVVSMMGIDKLNHATVNRIKDYDYGHTWAYYNAVIEEFKRRNYKVGDSSVKKILDVIGDNYSYSYEGDTCYVNGSPLYEDWHNDRYLKQCLYMLQERRDCSNMSNKEWEAIINKYPVLK